MLNSIDIPLVISVRDDVNLCLLNVTLDARCYGCSARDDRGLIYFDLSGRPARGKYIENVNILIDELRFRARPKSKKQPVAYAEIKFLLDQ